MSGNIPVQWIYNSHMGVGGCSIAVSVQWTILNIFHKLIKTYIVNHSDISWYIKHDSPNGYIYIGKPSLHHDHLNNMISWWFAPKTAVGGNLPWQQDRSFQTNCWRLRQLSLEFREKPFQHIQRETSCKPPILRGFPFLGAVQFDLIGFSNQKPSMASWASRSKCGFTAGKIIEFNIYGGFFSKPCLTLFD